MQSVATKNVVSADVVDLIVSLTICIGGGAGGAGGASGAGGVGGRSGGGRSVESKRLDVV